MTSHPRRGRRERARILLALAACLAALAAAVPVPARAAVAAAGPAAHAAPSSSAGGNLLESAASRAGDTGRRVAMSLIGLGFAIAAVVLAFKRDFKEAAGVVAVGLVAILLATPTGLNVLRDTVATLFGG